MTKKPFLYFLLLLISAVVVAGTGQAASLFYTVQIGSFARQNRAETAFERVLTRYPEAASQELRIEKVGAYFALRIGRFTNRAAARRLLAEVRPHAGGAMILQAYILPERTVRTTATGASLTTTGPEPPVGVDESGSAVTTEPEPPPTPGSITEEPLPPPDDRPAAAEAAEIAGEDDTGAPAAEPPESEPAGDEKGEQQEKEEKKGITVTMVAELKSDDLGSPLTYPSAVFTDAAHREIYAIGGGKGHIVIFDRDFYPVASFGGGRGIGTPTGGVVDRNGQVLICQSAAAGVGPHLAVYNGAFFQERTISFAGMPRGADFIPAQVAVGKSGIVYVIGANVPAVCTLNADLSFRSWLEVHDPLYDAIHGADKGVDLPVPIRDVYADTKGYLYFLSEDTSKIYVYDQNEKFLFAFGKKGGSTGKLSRPRALAVLEDLRLIVVVDYMRHVVAFFDLNGTFVDEVGGLGWGPKWFGYPTHVDVLPPDLIVVADNFNHRLQVLRLVPASPLPKRDPDRWR